MGVTLLDMGRGRQMGVMLLDSLHAYLLTITLFLENQSETGQCYNTGRSHYKLCTYMD